MKNVFLLLLTGWFIETADAQQDKYSNQRELRGNRRLIQEEYTVAPFQSIDIRQFLSQVTVDIGGTQSTVNVQLDSNLKPFLQVTSVDGVLTLAFKDPDNKPFWLSVGTIHVRVKTPALKQLQNESNGDVTVNNLSGPSFSLTNGGNGNVALQGSVDQLNIVSNANGTIKAKNLIAQAANVVTQANATVELNAKQVRSINSGHASVRNVTGATSQRLNPSAEPPETNLVTVTLQNNTTNARTVTLRFTEPGNPTYGVVNTTLGPYAKRRETYPVGTKIEQLTAQQQDIAMTGGETTGKLIVTLKASDNGRTYNLPD